MTPNKNEREWHHSMIDEMNERVAKQMKLPPDHPVMLDMKEMIQDVAELFIGEAEKRERARVLEEVNTMINKFARKEAGNDLLVVPLGIAVLGLVSLQSKDGKGE